MDATDKTGTEGGQKERVKRLGLIIETDSLIGGYVDGLRVYVGDSHVLNCN